MDFGPTLDAHILESEEVKKEGGREIFLSISWW
jgi:hypothetical protein